MSLRKLFRFKRVAWVIGFIILGGSFASLFFYHRWTRGPLPQLEGELVLPGLKAPVTVRRDAFGVPHIQAVDEEDLARAQGFVVAQDRLWQMDAMRRAARGELAEILGEKRLEFDLAQRRLGFSHVAERTYAALAPELRRKLDAFAAGVNAHIDANRSNLPIEFRLLRYEPRPWSPTDSLVIGKLMAQSLGSSYKSDLMRAEFAAKLDKPTFDRLFPSRNPLDQIVYGTDSPPPPREQQPASPTTDDPPDPPSDAMTAALSEPEREGLALVGLDGEGLGSNNWVVAGARTTTGKPILCNDPHLGHAVPSIWYQLHLTTADGRFNVSGFTFCGTPGVVLGHNADIAWGVTNFGPDVQDLFLETFHPSDPTLYKVGDTWEKAETRTEIVKVRVSPISTTVREERLTVLTTRHGPILKEIDGKRYALRWTALDTVTEYQTFDALDTARDWTDFQNALRKYPGPMQNFIYADREGNIGYWAAGTVPVRKSGDGSTPVDGASGNFDWTGSIPFENLPHTYNPRDGLIVTANQRITGASVAEFYTHEWASPYRAAAIKRKLVAKDRLSPDDMNAVHADTWSYPDDIFVREVRSLALRHENDPSWREIDRDLSDWNGELRADSRSAAVVTQWRSRFCRTLLAAKIGPALAKAYSWEARETFNTSLITDRPTDWLPPGTASYDDLLEKTYRETVSDLEAQLGKDHSAWRYGSVNTLEFAHPLSAVPMLKYLFNAPVLEMGGSGATPNAFGRGGVWGVSMRLIADLSNPDNSRHNLTVGESGQPASPHYLDQLDDWRAVRPHVTAFTPQAVERATRNTLVLKPRSG